MKKMFLGTGRIGGGCGGGLGSDEVHWTLIQPNSILGSTTFSTRLTSSYIDMLLAGH